ncbi:MAG: flagellar protein FlaG [Treponema sp.]|jgi:flagellar protein FlaG|nr:flagellar protein FlaG [Treponema sp.]
MNTIGSFVQSLAMEGHTIHASPVSSSKPNTDVLRNSENSLVTQTASDVAANLANNVAEIKADAQQLEKMSELISGRKLQFNVNNELGSVIVKIVDPNTDQVLKEIPSKDIQNLKINIRKAIGILFDDFI